MGTYGYSSEPESNSTVSNGNFEDTEEGPSNRTERSQESPDPEPDKLEETEPLDPELEQDPVTSLSTSFTAYGLNLFEPRPETHHNFTSLVIPITPSRSLQTDMAGPNDNTTTTNGTKDPKEIKLNYPKAFSGKRESLKKFIQDCSLYLLVNRKTYNNVLARITFVLPLMNEGDTAVWKEQMIDKAMADAITKNTELDLGTYKDFEKSLNKTFTPYDAPGDALEKMKELRMKIGESVDDHTAKFKMLVS